jgi:formyl-CoA transferase
MAVDQAGAPQDFSFPPRYGEHSEKILREVGYDLDAIAKLRNAHVIAGPDAVVARS